MDKKKKNIVIYLSDQQRYDTLGEAGIFSGVTPNLDRLCREGASFQYCTSVNPVCGPARACIQSGRYSTQTGNYRNGRELPMDDALMAVKLKEAGYRTAYIGKWHLHASPSPLKKQLEWDVPKKCRGGYDVWKASNELEFTSHTYGGKIFDEENREMEFTENRIDFLEKQAVQFLKKQTGESPFLLFISQLEPHQQNDENRFCAKRGSRELFADAPVPPDLVECDGDYEAYLPDYLGSCHDLDASVGNIVRVLKDQGLWDDTIFIYSSDHGCHFQTRNTEYKRSCHEDSVNVPLVITGGVFNGAGKRTELVSILDIPATVLSAAGVEIPECYEGIPLDQMIAGKVSAPDAVFIQISESQIGRAVRTKRWKYCVTAGTAMEALEKDAMNTYYEQYLYDLEADPWERNNLAEDEDYAAVRAELAELLRAYIKRVEKEDVRILPADKNPNPERRYSFGMSLAQMKRDEKVKPLLEKYFGNMMEGKLVNLGINMPFAFSARYAMKIPGMGKKYRKFEEELEKLNWER